MFNMYYKYYILLGWVTLVVITPPELFFDVSRTQVECKISEPRVDSIRYRRSIWEL